MDSCCECFGAILGGGGGGGSGGLRAINKPTEVTLDKKLCAEGCTLSSDGLTLSGTGACVANAPLVQDKSYFEFVIQSSEGSWVSK